MAERRMFTTKIIDSDAFLDMPLSAQSLYFHLNMRADDDGFINNPRKIQRMIGASDDDLKLLIAKRFLLVFETGVMVIKHWRMHNLLRKDRYSPTQYQEEYQRLKIKANGSYTETTGNQLATTWQPSDNQMAPQDSIGKDSIGKNSINSAKFTPPSLSEIQAYVKEKNLAVDPEQFMDYYQARGWILSNGKKMKDFRAGLRYWNRNQRSYKRPMLSDISERDNNYEDLRKSIPDPLADIEEA